MTFPYRLRHRGPATSSGVKYTNDCEEIPVVSSVLANPLILSNVFGHLATSDLLVCRQVCKDWNSLALDQIQKMNKKNLTMLAFNCNLGLNDVKLFIQTFENHPPNVPYSCYSFDLNYQWDLKRFLGAFGEKIEHIRAGHNYWNPVTPENLQTVLQLHGHHLKHLTIDFKGFKFSQKDIRRLQDVSMCTPNEILLPNLEWMTVVIGMMDEAEARNLCLFLKNLLSNLGNKLRTNLALHLDCNCMECPEFYGLLDIIRQCQCENDTSRNEDSFQVRCLEIGLSKNNKGFDDLYNFLSTHKTTIKKLTWKNEYFRFPKNMESLNQLVLGRHRVSSPVPAEDFSINYAASFPNVTYLEISSDQLVDYRERFQMIPQQSPCSSLRKLVISENQLSAEIMQRISIVFPNISSLIIRRFGVWAVNPERNEIFNAIWNSEAFASNLQVLSVSVREYPPAKKGPTIDELFSGASNSVLRRILDNKDFYENQFDHPEHSSILKLKNLRVLSIDSMGQGRRQKFTDAVGYCVFGQMKRLERLSLAEDVSEFSPECINKLKKKIGFVDLMGFRDYDENLKTIFEIKHPIVRFRSFPTTTMHNRGVMRSRRF